MRIAWYPFFKAFILGLLMIGGLEVAFACSRRAEACGGGSTHVSSPLPVFSYKVIKSYPHDRGAFTEGLVYDRGALYESTGLNGHSSVRKVALETGAVLQTRPLSDTFFGEGLTLFDNRLIQLTWQTHVGFVYNEESFAKTGEFSYPTEGWGLTRVGQRLIMSDGTATLHCLDPRTLKEVGRVQVRDDHGPVTNVNELEYVRGEVYANIWQTDRIARISPQTGQVLGWIDLTGLLGPQDRQQPVDVLNGIAYDAHNNRLFVTGKLWPRLFEIELVSTRN